MYSIATATYNVAPYYDSKDKTVTVFYGKDQTRSCVTSEYVRYGLVTLGVSAKNEAVSGIEDRVCVYRARLNSPAIEPVIKLLGQAPVKA